MKTNENDAWNLVKLIATVGVFGWLVITGQQDRDEEIRALNRIADALEKECSDDG